MKIALISDLHAELFVAYDSQQKYMGFLLEKLVVQCEQADLVVLAGDITTAHAMLKYTDHREMIVRFLQKLSKYGERRVIYIMGNHEYYGCSYFDNVHPLMEKFCNEHGVTNVDIVSREKLIKLDDIDLLAGTMWTDLSSPVDAYNVWRYMNDYNCISVEEYEECGDTYFKRPFTTEDATMMYKCFENAFGITITDRRSIDRPLVVATHHAPSFQSISTRYAESSANAGFYTPILERFYGSNPVYGICRMPILWVHGHTHYDVDYVVTSDIGATQVVAKQCGYEKERNDIMTYDAKIIEIQLEEKLC